MMRTTARVVETTARDTVPVPLCLETPSFSHRHLWALLLTVSQGKSRATAAQNSGTDTEDEASMISPNDANSAAMGVSASQPLSAIAERTVSGAEESEEDEDDVAGGWRPAKSVGALTGTGHTITVLHSGYLWKKGSGRRKVGPKLKQSAFSFMTLPH